MKTSLFSVVLSGVVAAGGLSAAHAEPAWPSKPIRLIVPFAAGGSTDIVARKVGQKLSEKVGQPVVVENKPGAGGTIGAAYARSQPGDGYTLFLGTVSTQSVAPFLYKSLTYDPVKDFTALAMIATVPNVVVVNKSLGISTLADLVEQGRSRQGGISYGSSGQGSSNHLATEGLRASLNVPFIHVPYRGSGPALTDTMAGHVDFMLDVVMTSLPYIQRGDLKAVAVTSKERVGVLPDVPTVAEQGYPEFEAIGWFGLFAPKGMPAPLVDQITDSIKDVLNEDDMKQYFLAQGAVPGGVTGKAFEAVVAKDREHWGKVANAAGINPE
ncbi:tripartite tricarboxylate transporter substrate binding protein [Achromobacter sp. NFACC18-2]|uniref:Bug family tripartite tricarboxylate transporter substrate binding protein n=1 Tax=Achromobacter sp. NFACC18-2 TaxID=1564112 RepID=UPI0008D503AD|nr:tripartite tricarboxylate transporter substrate binding protein [Achromobacter sp. NFACC18-2]SEI60474.1 Tripartite-type tricarboxylate transporter, receptor component TctC [Achromobacter sp. NFACC18-2]